jgi:hypothetical protein
MVNPSRSATRAELLARAYHRSLALRWWATVVAMPALVPLLLARGLGLAEVGLVMATFAAVTAALELPTGGLADAFGRVRTALVADVLAILGRLAFLLASDLGGFVAAAALGGAARALGSGALEAWYVDARRRLDPDGDLRAPLGRAGVVASLALATGTVVGGLVPLAAPWLGLGDAAGVGAMQLAFAASVALGIVALTATARLRDEDAGPPAGHAAARPDRVFLGAWSALRADPALAGLALVGAATGGIVMAYEALFPAELAARWGASVTPVLGAALAGAFVATAIGQGLGAGARGRSTAGTTVIGYALAALGTGALAPTLPAPWGVAVALGGMWVVYGAIGYAGPALAAAFHARTPPERRAALLSVHSLAAYGGGVAASLGLGAAAAAFGTPVAWAAVAAAAAITATATAMARIGVARGVRFGGEQQASATRSEAGRSGGHPDPAGADIGT